MRRLLLCTTTLVFTLSAHALAAPGGSGQVSEPSPLKDRCDANERTLLYGEDIGLEEEVSVAIHPADPNHIVVAWAQDHGLGIVAASTVDGGQAWTRVVVPGLSACTGGAYDRVIHPRLSFGADGVVYLLTTPLDGFFPDPRSAVAHIAVSRSQDGGATWLGPELLDSSSQPVFNDLGGLAAEPDSPGAAVVVWSNPEVAVDTMYVSRTTDHGRTWTATPVRDPALATVAGKTVVAHPNGTLLVFVWDEPLESYVGAPGRPQPVSVLRSADKGRTWSAAVQVAEHAEAIFWPVAATSPDGTTHLLWGTGTDDGRLRLRLRSSDDAGATWGAEQEVTTIAAGQQPSMVAGPHGLVAVAYYETAADGRSVLLTTSADGGATWTSSRLAGPFAEANVNHWVLGEMPISYQLGLALRGDRPTAAFVASGNLASDGLTDVWVATAPN